MKNDDVPEDVMKAADSVCAEIGIASFYYTLNPIARAIMAERQRCATIASRYADGYEAGLPCYGAADKDSGRGRQEGHIKAGRDIAEAISAGKDAK